MIRELFIENYKSVQKLEMELGRFTVLVGENGCGKTNILESVALCSAAANYKLDNEFLVSRGIRVTDDPRFMRALFNKENITKEIKICLKERSGKSFQCLLQNDNKPYSKWVNKEDEPCDIDKQFIEVSKHSFIRLFENEFEKYVANEPDTCFSENVAHLKKGIKSRLELIKETAEDFYHSFCHIIMLINAVPRLHKFLVFSPEKNFLRTFEKQGQIRPLGVKGEGLFKLLKVISSDVKKERFDEIKEMLRLTGWLKDIEIPQDSPFNEKVVLIKDRYLDESLDFIDQKNSSEGFMFLLFYFTLFISNKTPDFFAIENIDASLNPKLCSRIIKELVRLAEKYDKQVIVTTHNSAVLDGLNIDIDNQRLFVIYRNESGSTEAKRIFKQDIPENVKLSEAYLSGKIGGIPSF
ncbi:MAG: ATP-binding protein [Desulfobacteraceae bacterium]|nr:ATP-binding protein [Desulfobacteraceae bacterium]